MRRMLYNGSMATTANKKPLVRTCTKKPRCCLTGCLLIVVACFIAVLWMFVARFCWWLGGRIENDRVPHDQTLDFSGEYLAEIKKMRQYTIDMDHPFLPDYLFYSNAHVTITQYGMTNMTVISQSLSGEAQTNSINISGWMWRWGSNSLEYANTVIGPGLGFLVFPGLLKSKSRCNVEAIQTEGSARQALHVNFVNKRSGLMLFVVPWSDPDDTSEVILMPISTP